MMSGVIRQEAAVFLGAVLLGMLLTVLYDVLRILRRIIRHGLLVVSAEDFLYWLAAGVMIFCFAYKRTEGIVRGYTALGIVLGSVLYHEICSDWLVNIAVRVINIPYKSIAAFFRKRKGDRRNEKTQKTYE